VLPEEGAAVRSYLQAVGITANLVQLPAAEAVVRAEAGQAPLFLGTWGSYSINDVAAFLPHFFGGGPLDYGRRPDVVALVLDAGRMDNVDERRRAYAQAIRQITEQALWLPMRTYPTTYGITRALDFRPSPDELPRWYLARWR
jgi:peptide/nickel transport system substrate-binding protein